MGRCNVKAEVSCVIGVCKYGMSIKAGRHSILIRHKDEMASCMTANFSIHMTRTQPIGVSLQLLIISFYANHFLASDWPASTSLRLRDR